VWTLLRLTDISPEPSVKILLYFLFSHLIIRSLTFGALWLS
jgi:hypothetical protein